MDNPLLNAAKPNYINDAKDSEVLQWINKFVMHQCSTYEEYEVLRATFRGGYCYYFAHMLQLAFDRGTVCFTAPFSHWVWEDLDGKLYDIEGLYEGEAFYFIPENEYTLNDMSSFKHRDGIEFVKPSPEDCINMMKEYCARNSIQYNPDVEWFLKQGE